MTRFLAIAAVALLAGSAVQAQTHATRGDDSLPVTSAAHPPLVNAAPEFHPASAIAALTLLLCGVAVLKGWRRE
jgi:hypothetical protein